MGNALRQIEDGGQHHFIFQIGNPQSAIRNWRAGSSVGNESGTIPA
jgi:hypothetical protein